MKGLFCLYFPAVLVALFPAAVVAEPEHYVHSLRGENQEREARGQALGSNPSNPSTLSTRSSCLDLPLPALPGSPSYAMTYSGSDEGVAFEFWREPCKDGAGEALLLRVAPTSGTPFLCSSAFAIVQEGVQRNDIKLQSGPASSSWCSDLYVETTLIVNQYELGEPQFDPSQSLTVFFEGFRQDLSVEIPSGEAPIPGAVGQLRGYLRYWGSCRNVTTGQAVKLVARSGGKRFDCAAAGLEASPGDRVTVTLTGSVK